MNKTSIFILALASLCSAFVFAQSSPSDAVVGLDAESPRVVAGADVNNLIESLIGGRSAVVHLRVFSGGQLQDHYSEATGGW